MDIEQAAQHFLKLIEHKKPSKYNRVSIDKEHKTILVDDGRIYIQGGKTRNRRESSYKKMTGQEPPYRPSGYDQLAVWLAGHNTMKKFIEENRPEIIEDHPLRDIGRHLESHKQPWNQYTKQHTIKKGGTLYTKRHNPQTFLKNQM